MRVRILREMVECHRVIVLALAHLSNTSQGSCLLLNECRQVLAAGVMAAP
jgi:hypothetical protein